MHRRNLLIVTALGEVGIGVLLLVWPPWAVQLLLGIDQISAEVIVIGRITGAALLALGVICWIGRSDSLGSAALGLIFGVIIYDVSAAAILAYSGLFLHLAGLILWPAVVLHTALAIWSVKCLSVKA
jgi:hypothetical protein